MGDGGWELKNPNCAIVIAYWKNEQSYAEFMAGQHGALNEPMRKTYTAVEISTGHVITTVNRTDPKTAVTDCLDLGTEVGKPSRSGAPSEH